MKDLAVSSGLEASRKLDETAKHSNENIDDNLENEAKINKWSTKEKLFLISFVLINGDNDWSFVSDELNKWMQLTNKSNLLASKETVSTRTSVQCSKQYKLIIRNFVRKHGFSDLKKVYNELADERLNELRNVLVINKQEYIDLSKEIEQILAMNVSNFEELTKLWLSLKDEQAYKANESVNETQKIIQLIQINKDDEVEEVNLNRNLKKIYYLKEKKQREIEEEAERKRLQLIEEQRQRELEERLAREQKEKEEAERIERENFIRKQKEEEEEAKRLLLEKEEQERLLNEMKKESEAKLDESIEEKSKKEDEVNKKIPIAEDASQQLKAREMEEEKIPISNVDDAESDDDDNIPLNIIKEKNTRSSQHIEKKELPSSTSSSSLSSSTIEWKPQVVNESQNKASIIDEKSQVNKAKKLAQGDKSITKQPKKSQADSTSSSPSPKSTLSDTEANDTIKMDTEANETIKIDTETPNNLSSSSSKLTTRSTSKLAKTSTSKNIKTEPLQHQQSDDASELIFTPLIKCDKEEKDESSEKTPDTNIKPRKSLAGRKKGSTKHQITESPQLAHDQSKQDDDESSSANRSLRSKLRSNQTPQSQNLSVNAKRKSFLPNKQSSKQDVSQDANLSPNSSINTSSLKATSPIHAKTSSTDSGLLSIIKSEPIQLSTTSTICSNDSADTIDSKNEENQTPLTTRSKSTHQQEITLSSSSMSNQSYKFEDEKTYKAWKKSIMMVLNNIACHKHATIFMHPVKDEIAPGYSNVVFRPMDLSTIKKNIENGAIKSTREFQRDIMLMFTNAIMYNSSGHDVHKISLEMYKETLSELEQLLNAQETMGEDTKLRRFKDIRSSTTSDRGGENDKNENNESVNEVLVSLLMKSKKEQIKDDNMETSSIKSSSSISTPLTSNSNSNSNNKSKLDNSSIKSNQSNSRKRRPSVKREQTSQQTASNSNQPPKAKRSRKSTR